MSILEAGTQSTGSESPVEFFMYLYSNPPWIIYTAFIRSDSNFLAVLALRAGHLIHAYSHVNIFEVWAVQIGCLHISDTAREL